MPTLQDVKKYIDGPDAPKRLYGTGNVAVDFRKRDIQARYKDPVTGKPKFVGTGIVPENYEGKNAVARAVADALKWLDRERNNAAVAKADAAAAATKAVVEGWTVRHVCEDYLAWLKHETENDDTKKRSMRSVEDAERNFERFVYPWIGEEIADEWAGIGNPKQGVDNAKQFRKTLENMPRIRGPKSRRLAVATVQLALRTLLAAFNHAKDEGNVRMVPTFKMKKERVRTGKFTKDEIEAIAPFFSPSVRPLFVAACNSGLRSQQELLLTTWDDVDWKRGMIRVPGERTKNGVGRDVPMLDGGAMSALAESYEIWREKYSHLHNRAFYWREASSGNAAGAPIVNYYGAFKQAMRRAAAKLNREEIAARSPHDCRRTFAKNFTLDNPTFTLEDLMELGGWKSAATAMRYLDGNKRNAAGRYAAVRDAKAESERPVPANVISMPRPALAPAPADDLPNDFASLVAAGLTHAQIAVRLDLSLHQVKARMKKLLAAERAS